MDLFLIVYYTPLLDIHSVAILEFPYVRIVNKENVPYLS